MGHVTYSDDYERTTGKTRAVVGKTPVEVTKVIEAPADKGRHEKTPSAPVDEA